MTFAEVKKFISTMDKRDWSIFAVGAFSMLVFVSAINLFN